MVPLWQMVVRSPQAMPQNVAPMIVTKETKQLVLIALKH